MAIVAGLVAVLVILVVVIVRGGDSSGDAQVADLGGQGAPDTVFAADAARLERRIDGVVVEMDVPTPVPGSYEYPTGDMVAPWADPHPPVSAGAANAPEVFTVWLISFNDPEMCSEGRCDADDLPADAPASGGVYQLDGRVGHESTMTFVGNVRVGQQPETGSPLQDPIGSEIHVAIAPHGRELPGTDGWRQLNGPVGNPSLWWVAEFPSQE